MKKGVCNPCLAYQKLVDLEMFLENMFRILSECQVSSVREKVANEWTDYLKRKDPVA